MEDEKETKHTAKTDIAIYVFEYYLREEYKHYN